jgi:hypothetical protein
VEAVVKEMSIEGVMYFDIRQHIVFIKQNIRTKNRRTRKNPLLQMCCDFHCSFVNKLIHRKCGLQKLFISIMKLTPLSDPEHENISLSEGVKFFLASKTGLMKADHCLQLSVSSSFWKVQK